MKESNWVKIQFRYDKAGCVECVYLILVYAGKARFKIISNKIYNRHLHKMLKCFCFEVWLCLVVYNCKRLQKLFYNLMLLKLRFLTLFFFKNDFY